MLTHEGVKAIKNVRDSFSISLREARDLWDTYGSEAAMRTHLEDAGRTSTRPRPTYAALEALLRELYSENQHRDLMSSDFLEICEKHGFDPRPR